MKNINKYCISHPTTLTVQQPQGILLFTFIEIKVKNEIH